MKVVKRTDDYIIYQKPSERYAVRGRDKQWVNGDDKVRILLEHNLIETAPPKAPAEAAAEAEPTDDAAAAADEGAAEDAAPDEDKT